MKGSKVEKKPSKKINERGAGILLHITSLPSEFGIGDFGSQAYLFADFLKRSKQKFWQILPLNPTEAPFYSPYSAISCLAGNTLLISPELLAEGKFLDAELSKYKRPNPGKVDFKEAEKLKNELLEKAFMTFEENRGEAFKKIDSEFIDFCKKEQEWLHNFATYVALKKHHKNEPWYNWPENYKKRNSTDLANFSEENKHEIEKAKWMQFIFFKQWHTLKTYCNQNEIQLFGDMPIYVSYDSADVWSNPEIFNIDSEGNLIGVAGVPPDYFNDLGQLWGMPVFRWDVLKKHKYDWWIRRIRKNLELFDIVRLDHFRAFANYWEVPASETTAINGTWKTGPGSGFFTELKKNLGELPFIAEDLGEINQAVFDLRDEFKLPGMKILQFAFFEDMPISDHAPHNHTSNFTVYTGTHDNNTTIGWFRKELDKKSRQRIFKYINQRVTEKNVHIIMGRLAYSSIAKICILPLQDLHGLDETARMNNPASLNNNWQWRLMPQQLTAKTEKTLKEWVILYNR